MLSVSLYDFGTPPLNSPGLGAYSPYDRDPPQLSPLSAFRAAYSPTTSTSASPVAVYSPSSPGRSWPYSPAFVPREAEDVIGSPMEEGFYNWAAAAQAAAALPEEEEEEAEEGCDNCSICLNAFRTGKAAVVCNGMHTVCHGCHPRLYAAEFSWTGGGKCPLCRASLLALNEKHPFADSLPDGAKARVEAAKARADARFVDRIRREQEQDRATAARQQQRALPAPAAAPAPRRRKRSSAEYLADIAAETDAQKRAFMAAHRLHTQTRSKLNTRAWRAKRKCSAAGTDWTTDAEYLRLKRAADEWLNGNPTPLLADFPTDFPEVAEWVPDFFD